MADCRFRFANENDCRLILKFIRSLAKYEKMEDEVVATEELLREWLFEKKKAEVIFAMDGEEVVGFALFFHNFSTFLGRAGIYLEDLYVRPSYRGKGYGKALLEELAHIAVIRGCGRLEWACLDWNQPSIDFYKSLGAVPLDEWTVYRAAGKVLLEKVTSEVVCLKSTSTSGVVCPHLSINNPHLGTNDPRGRLAQDKLGGHQVEK